MREPQWRYQAPVKRSTSHAISPATAEETDASVASVFRTGPRGGSCSLSAWWTDSGASPHSKSFSSSASAGHRSASHARALGRFGIDGESVFHQARRIAGNIELTGKVICEGNR